MLRYLKYAALAVVAFLVLLTLCIAIPLPSGPGFASQPNHFVLLHVNIVDTESGGVQFDQAVTIADGKIKAIVPANEFSTTNLKVIEAMGQYLLPGLWDMHTHSLKISPQLHHPLFIRYGVTSVRDMSGCLNADDAYWACPHDRRRWQAEAINGERVSPRYPIQSSYQLNGGSEVPGSFPDFFRVADMNSAQQLADYYAAEGVHFIKTYTELTFQQFVDLALAADTAGLAIAGHRPLAVSLQQALAANMRSIEHGRLFMFECFAEAAAFRAADDPIGQYDATFMRQLIEQQDEIACDQLMTKMAISQTHWVPTLTTLKMSAMAQDAEFRGDPRLAYIPWILRKLIWEQDINRAARNGDDEAGNFVHGDFYAATQQQVYAAQSSGVKILAGTDNIDTYVFTGSSLHDELASLVEAGLSPLQALQTATIEPARFSGLDDEFGSVEVGKQADLILLNSNPLEAIENTTDIAAVIFAGRVFDTADLIALDAFAKASASSLRVNLRFFYDMLASPLMRAQLAD